MVCLLHEKACKGTTKNAHGQIFLEKNVFLYKKVRFLKIAISFPSLIPCRISPTDDRETTERTPTQLPVTKKCCFLRLLLNQVVLIPKKVDSFPKIVDLSISQQNHPITLKTFKTPKTFPLKICTSANFVVPLHREPALGMSALGLYSRVRELAATMLNHSTQHYTTLNNAAGEG